VLAFIPRFLFPHASVHGASAKPTVEFAVDPSILDAQIVINSFMLFFLSYID